MPEEQINIGCKLPHGLVLEIGLDPKTGIPTEKYRNAVLQGTLQARKGAKFGSAFVPRDLWDAWVAKNKKFRYVVDGSVFVVK
jgi:hypothetical protein